MPAHKCLCCEPADVLLTLDVLYAQVPTAWPPRTGHAGGGMSQRGPATQALPASQPGFGTQGFGTQSFGGMSQVLTPLACGPPSPWECCLAPAGVSSAWVAVAIRCSC